MIGDSYGTTLRGSLKIMRFVSVHQIFSITDFHTVGQVNKAPPPPRPRTVGWRLDYQRGANKGI